MTRIKHNFQHHSRRRCLRCHHHQADQCRRFRQLLLPRQAPRRITQRMVINYSVAATFFCTNPFAFYRLWISLLYFSTSLFESTIHYAEINSTNENSHIIWTFMLFMNQYLYWSNVQQKNDSSYLKCMHSMVNLSLSRIRWSCSDASTLIDRVERQIISSPVISLLQYSCIWIRARRRPSR